MDAFQPTPVQSRSTKKPRSLFFYPFLILVALVLGGLGYYFFQKQQFNSTAASEAAELKQVVTAVGKLMDLPQDETPVLATVTDREKIKTQAFFARSENGDKVLLYTTLGRAILYRPSTNKIVDVTLINTTNTTDAPTESTTNPLPVINTPVPALSSTPTPTPATQTRVILLNGTATPGLTNSAETRLLAENTEIQIVQKANAAQQNYATTQVIALSTSATTEANQIASLFNTTVTQQLPLGESANGADIVVILGTDAQ
jgi:hypothetical protein